MRTARGQQQVLRFDPTHRGGKLPGQQLHQQRAAKPLRVCRGCCEVLQDGRNTWRINDLGDGLHKVTVQSERLSNEVGHIAPHQHIQVNILRDELIQVSAEIIHPVHQA